MIARRDLSEIQPSLLPAHAQASNPEMLSNTRYLYDYMPLPSVEPAKP